MSFWAVFEIYLSSFGLSLLGFSFLSSLFFFGQLVFFGFGLAKKNKLHKKLNPSKERPKKER
jgi:hypothetical protein